MPLNSKKTEISFLNILFCIIVMFVHISSEPMSKLDKSSIQYIFVLIPWRLSAFIVQGYIFLSSLKLFLKNTDKFNYKEFLKNRVKLIFVPYLMWVMVYYLYFCSIDYFDFKLLDYVRYVLNGSIVSPFYFVIIIFQFYILMPLWTNLFKKYKSSVLVVTSLFIMILSKKYFPVIFGDSFKYYDRILTTYIFYWFWGCAVGLNYNSFKNFVTKNTIICNIFSPYIKSDKSILIPSSLNLFTASILFGTVIPLDLKNSSFFNISFLSISFEILPLF